MAAAAEPPVKDGGTGGAGFESLDASGTVLKIGPLRVELRSGYLFSPRGEAGGSGQWVFVGEGRARLTVEDPVERRQLLYFTGFPSLDERFRSAVFAAGPGEVRRMLASRPPVPAPAPDAGRARALWRAWRRAPERSFLETEHLLLGVRYEDPGVRGAASALIEGEVLGRFAAAVWPGGHPWFLLGKFTPWDVSGRERKKIDRALRKAVRRRWLEAEAVLEGDWAGWVSLVRDPDRKAASGPRHAVSNPLCELELDLEGSKLAMSGAATFHLTAEREGTRVLGIELPVLLVDVTVTGPGGTKLAAVRDATTEWVVLPHALARGESVKLTVHYRSKAMLHLGRKAYVLAAPDGWYPLVEDLAPRTWELTLRWPKRLDLLAPGDRVGEERVAKGYRTRTVRLSPGSSGLTFAVGDFDVRRTTLDGAEITVAADRTARKLRGRSADDLLQAVVSDVEALRPVFGPLPFGRLTVVTSEEALSRSLPGFIELSSPLMADQGPLAEALGIYATPEGVLAHEITHQWLGNSVEPASERDVWWVEGAANFVAERVMIERAAAEGRHPHTGLFPRRILPEELLLSDGLAYPLLSPPVLGSRLLSGPRGIMGYIETMYDRAAQFFFLMDATTPSRDLLSVLGTVAQRHAHREMSGDELLDALSKELQMDVSKLVGPLLRGDPPGTVLYGYSPAGRNGGRWRLSGRAHFSAILPRSTVELGAAGDAPDVTPAQRWIVSRFHPPVGIPFGVFAKVSGDDALTRRFGTFRGKFSLFALYRQETATYGLMLLDRPNYRFRTSAPFPPAELRLDPDAQLPLVTISQNRSPAMARLAAGVEECAAGRLEAGRDWFDDVVNLCEHRQDEGQEPAVNDALETECLTADTAAWTHLGELSLARGDVEGAKRALSSANRNLEALRHAPFVEDLPEIPAPRSLTILKARIALAEGRPRQAYDLLAPLVLERHRPLPADGYAVLAVAAASTGHPHLARHCREAWRIMTGSGGP